MLLFIHVEKFVLKYAQWKYFKILLNVTKYIRVFDIDFNEITENLLNFKHV